MKAIWELVARLISRYRRKERPPKVDGSGVPLWEKHPFEQKTLREQSREVSHLRSWFP